MTIAVSTQNEFADKRQADQEDFKTLQRNEEADLKNNLKAQSTK